MQATVGALLKNITYTVPDALHEILGYDKGGADMIADGRIAFKSGVTPNRLTEKSLVLSDGSELPADVVVFAYVETPAEPCPLSHY